MWLEANWDLEPRPPTPGRCCLPVWWCRVQRVLGRRVPLEEKAGCGLEQASHVHLRLKQKQETITDPPSRHGSVLRRAAQAGRLYPGFLSASPRGFGALEAGKKKPVVSEPRSTWPGRGCCLCPRDGAQVVTRTWLWLTAKVISPECPERAPEHTDPLTGARTTRSGRQPWGGRPDGKGPGGALWGFCDNPTAEAGGRPSAAGKKWAAVRADLRLKGNGYETHQPLSDCHQNERLLLSIVF